MSAMDEMVEAGGNLLRRVLDPGVAGARFHRPESGIGLSEKSSNCLQAVRRVEGKVKFWEVDPLQDLLTDCGLDEAYLAAKPGQKYILFFTDAGSVQLKLDAYVGASFELNWVGLP